MTSVSTDRRFGVNSGKAIKVPCKAATTANITLSGEQTIDGVSCVTGDRVLVRSQSTSSQNGIWIVDTGSWSRAVDFDDINDVTEGTLIPINNGTTYGDSLFKVDTTGTITPGTTSLSFSLSSHFDVSTLNPIENIAALRSVDITPLNGFRVYVKGYVKDGDDGAGFFRVVTGASAGTYVDDNVDIVLPSGGNGSAAFIREYRKKHKSPTLTWENINVLWLGTSIPHQGAGTDGYPELFGSLMSASIVDNQSWSGSHATWNKNDPDKTCATNPNTVKGLSATQREIQYEIDNATVGSAYLPACSATTIPLEQSYEHRINARFAIRPYQVVFLDHAHNDRSNTASDYGTLNPTPISVLAIAKGATTSITLNSGHGLVQYSNITLRTSDIPGLDYWTGEISSIAGDVAVINKDSTALSGTYVSGGTVVSYDKSKVYDAFNFLISNIYHMDVTYGLDHVNNPVKIILSTPPTVFSGGSSDGRIERVNSAIYDLADKWNLSVYDMTADMNIRLDDLYTYLGDGIHPTTVLQRQIIANHIARWANGGSAKISSQNPFNYAINGGCIIKQRSATPALSNTAQYGVDMIKVYMTGTVTAGTITQDTAASFGSSTYASHVSGVSNTTGGNMHHLHYTPPEYAKRLKNKKVTVSCKILHDTGASSNSVISVYKANALGNFAAVTLIETSSTMAVASGEVTTLQFTLLLNDCSNGLLIDIVSGLGIITTKNYRLTEIQIVEAGTIQPYNYDYFSDLNKCEQFYREEYYLTNARIIEVKVSSTSTAFGGLPYPTMYKIPTVTVSNSTDFNVDQYTVTNGVTNITNQTKGNRLAHLTISSTLMVADVPATLTAASSAAKIYFDSSF